MFEAEKYGPVVDLAFPYVNPVATSEDIGRMALEYLEKVERLLEEDTVVVHIMGESNFCFALISLLKNKGIDCLASTTHRSVAYLPEGEKVVQFEFCQFRKY